jgi:hypothetical protein
MAAKKVKFVRRRVVLTATIKIRSDSLKDELRREALKKEIANSISDITELYDGDSFEVDGKINVYLKLSDFQKAHVLELLAASAIRRRPSGREKEA